MICVGRRARDPLLDAADAYAARLQRYVALEVVRLRESDPTREANQILARLPEGHHAIALCAGAGAPTTEALAARLSACAAPLSFVVGGAFGLAPPVLARAQGQLSLSPLTLPHRLALVMLLEQLYRVQTIWRGERYHHA